MGEPLTADDLLPLIARLSASERTRLLRLIKTPEGDVNGYIAAPPGRDEFSADGSELTWDADGWENFA